MGTVIVSFFTPDLIDLLGRGGEPDQARKSIGSGTLFIIFGGFSIISALVCFFILKETKGLTDKELAILYSSEKAEDVI